MNNYEIIYDTNEVSVAIVNKDRGGCSINKHIAIKVKNPSLRVSETRWIPVESFKIEGVDSNDLKDSNHPFYKGDYRGKVIFKTYNYKLEIPDKYFSKGMAFHNPETVLYEDNDNKFKIVAKNKTDKGGLKSEVYFEYNGVKYAPNSDRFSDKFIEVWKKYALNGQKISEELDFGIDYAIKEPLISPLEFII